ncbi:MAG: SurA N-terminal domain-containing protein [Myxococcaceae bacterium]|nr:SurA N-terminal domain-containing protein [Myxococcaceae bacterium]
MILLLALWLSATPKAVLVDRIVATVDDRVITTSLVDQRMVRFKETREQALTSLIERLLITRACRAVGLEVTPNDVESALAEIISKNQLTQPQFEHELKRQGWELAAYKLEVQGQLLELKWLTLGAERGKELGPERERLLKALAKTAVIEVRK